MRRPVPRPGPKRRIVGHDPHTTSEPRILRPCPLPPPPPGRPSARTRDSWVGTRPQQCPVPPSLPLPPPGHVVWGWLGNTGQLEVWSVGGSSSSRARFRNVFLTYGVPFDRRRSANGCRGRSRYCASAARCSGFLSNTLYHCCRSSLRSASGRSPRAWKQCSAHAWPGSGCACTCVWCMPACAVACQCVHVCECQVQDSRCQCKLVQGCVCMWGCVGG